MHPNVLKLNKLFNYKDKNHKSKEKNKQGSWKNHKPMVDCWQGNQALAHQAKPWKTSETHNLIQLNEMTPSKVVNCKISPFKID